VYLPLSVSSVIQAKLPVMLVQVVPKAVISNGEKSDHSRHEREE
jgi:hypothetical protein